jgi:hypothetical protein
MLFNVETRKTLNVLITGRKDTLHINAVIGRGTRGLYPKDPNKPIWPPKLTENHYNLGLNIKSQ